MDSVAAKTQFPKETGLRKEDNSTSRPHEDVVRIQTVLVVRCSGVTGMETMQIPRQLNYFQHLSFLFEVVCHRWLLTGISLEPVTLLMQTVYEISAMNEVGRDSDFVC